MKSKAEKLKLSEKHREMMPLLLEGKTTEEMAATLGEKVRTLSSRLHVMYKVNKTNNGAKLAWRWMQEEYALVPRCAPDEKVKVGRPFLLGTDKGFVSARFTEGVWRDVISLKRVPEEKIESVHKISSY